MTLVRQIRESDVRSFRDALDSVCRERRFLATLEAPPLERVQRFVSTNVQRDLPQFVAVEGAEVVGWCDAIPGDAESGTAHVGRLGMGVRKEHRSRRIGQRLGMIANTLTNLNAKWAALGQRRAKTRALKLGMMQELLTRRTKLVEGGKLRVDSEGGRRG